MECIYIYIYLSILSAYGGWSWNFVKKDELETKVDESWQGVGGGKNDPQ